MYTFNKHVRWRKDINNMLICDCKRLIDLKIPLDYEITMKKIERGIDEKDLREREEFLIKDFKNLKLLANLEIRAIRKNEFNSAMKLLDRELKIRVRTNKFLFEKFKEFGELFIGVFLDNEIIGLVCGFPREDYVLMSEIAVDERFQKRGFGKRLVKAFEQKALKFGGKINVGAMDNVIEFYKSLDYHPFLLIQFNNKDYSLKDFSSFRLIKTGSEFIEAEIKSCNINNLKGLRKKYSKAHFQYIFTKKIG
ncbi:MAG: GNAT family N-acetyltransferase [Nanoarchaeota archaeon]